MGFATRLTEARLALNLVSSFDMPKLAWEALEAGMDGPAIRRLAALQNPTFFQVQAVLTAAMEEMKLAKIEKPEAAIRLVMHRIREILGSGTDPLPHIPYFEHIWIEADYSKELQVLGCLDDQAYLARLEGQDDEKIRVWVQECLTNFVAGRTEDS